MTKHFFPIPDLIRHRIPMRAIERVAAGVATGVLIAATMWLATSPAHAATPPAQGSLSQVFKRVDPAVVVIRTSEHVEAVVPGAPPGGAASVAFVGSGVLISADGKVVTAAHVVQTADSVDVEFTDGTVVKARIVASDGAADVALLQLERVPPNIAPARLGNSDKTEVGDQVFIVGAPRGITHTLTVGHVSARRQPKAISAGFVSTELFQTDAAINRGNSGGPMFDMNGNVIGIVSHIVSGSGGSEGLGFVVTSNMARRLLLEERSVWHGLDGYLITDEIAHTLNLPTGGLLVQRVARGSPAERMGLRGGRYRVAIESEQLLIGGDVIVAVDGIELAEPDAYERVRRRLLDVRASGGLMRLSLMRDGVLTKLIANFE
jgi:S1-C subfamily serine protease